MLARSLSVAVTIALGAPCFAAPPEPPKPARDFVLAAATPARITAYDLRFATTTMLPRLRLVDRVVLASESPRDRFDMRVLPVKPQWRERPAFAGLRLTMRDDMDASLGATGALKQVIDRPIIE